jgi:hypothetical protein
MLFVLLMAGLGAIVLQVGFPELIPLNGVPDLRQTLACKLGCVTGLGKKP